MSNCIPCGHHREDHVPVPDRHNLFQCKKCTCCRTREQMGGTTQHCDKCGHESKVHITREYGEVECLACGCRG